MTWQSRDRIVARRVVRAWVGETAVSYGGFRGVGRH